VRLWPRTLFGQLLLALLSGLLIAQALGVWLMLDDRARLGARLVGEFAAMRVAGVISILDRAPPPERARLARALDVPPTRLSLTEPWLVATSRDNAEATLFVQRVTRVLGHGLPMQVVAMRSPQRAAFSLRAPDSAIDASAPWPHRRGPFVVIQARLDDGAIVTFRHDLPPHPDWPVRAVSLLILMGLSVVLLAGWAVRRLTRPLASLADAASGLARNLDQAPLPETGPTEVARAATAFNAMQRELKRIIETRSQALAGVSHDLRLPITRLRLRLESIADPALKTRIEADLAEMDAMISNTMEFLRAGNAAEPVVPINLNALLEAVVEDMQVLGASIRVHGEAQRPFHSRPQALQRCLLNLLDNARRYGGNDIDLTLIDRTHEVEIRIEDRGPGIAPTERERVFDPYVRLETSRAKHTGGTGLGLTIARAIARFHGGDVSLNQRDGGGLSVLLRLPRSDRIGS
jgi:Signal transduction histidine kinase